MKLGLQLGYWSGTPPTDARDKVLAAERLGFDAVFTAESYGSDALTPLAWWGAETTRLRLGTGILAMAARTPAATAMAALTLDHLSEGRAILGLGLSGPQVVEGWHGQPFNDPITRTREYVDIVRQVLARSEPVTSREAGHYPIPFRGAGSTGLGRPVKSIVRPLRADLPIWLAAEGPRNVALAGEIADGWLPLFYAPRASDMYQRWLGEGFARAGARRAPGSFEVAAVCMIAVTNDIERALDELRPRLGLFIGGMGAKNSNFHKNVFCRMGYEKEAEEIQALFLEGKQDQAIAAVPREMAADVSLIGSATLLRDRVAEWEESGVTMLVMSGSTLEQMQRVAEAVLS